MPTKLTGQPVLTYLGVEAPQPPNIVAFKRPPTTNDYLTFNTGDMWIDISGLSNTPPTAPTNEDIWMLVSKNKQINNATWVNFGGGDLETLTGNTGGPVAGDANDNINILGINGITVAGNPGINTLNITTTGGGPILQTLTGDVGGAVQPDGAGNINTLGTAGHITTTGNPGTHTITWDLDASIADQYTTDAGIAVPVANNLNVFGGTAGRDINTTGAGDTIHVELNNAITLGDLVALGANVGAMTAVTGDVIITAGDLTLPNTNAAGNQGIIKFGGNRWISNFGTSNTFVGEGSGNTTLTVVSAVSNTGVGSFVLDALTTGGANSAFGINSLTALTVGINNTSIGGSSGQSITTGSNNTFLGANATPGLTQGDNNICLGFSAGGSLATTDSNNIMIGNTGIAGDNFIMRIGNSLFPLQKVFCEGIRGVTTDVNDAVAVLIDSVGQLGTTSSSIRYKENIEDMGSSSDDVMKLRPVIFNYKKDESKKLQFGLIAEEVREVFPRLVVHNKEGLPESVKYHELPSILLNEIQKLSKRIEELERKLNV